MFNIYCNFAIDINYLNSCPEYNWIWWWGITSSLLLFPGPLWLGVVAPVRLPFMHQIELFLFFFFFFFFFYITNLRWYICVQVVSMRNNWIESLKLNSNTSNHLNEFYNRIWHWITHKGWYHKTQPNQTQGDLIENCYYYLNYLKPYNCTNYYH